ncbi:MAG: arylsulfatase A-like enzyme [Planctomycetota bacterium]|jgi:arylsulfatase A-like enzyme
MLIERLLHSLGATLLLASAATGVQTSSSTSLPGSYQTQDPDELPTNVVMIFIDDVGPDLLRIFDEINLYNGASDPFTDGIYIQSPNIDAAAKAGVTFLNAYSVPVCSAARSSLLTGMRTTKTGVGKVIRPDLVGALTEFGDPGFEWPTLAQVVQSRGGHAGIFGKWHLGLHADSPGPPGVLGWPGIRQRGHWDEIWCTFANLDIEPKPDNNPGYYSYYHHVDTNGTGQTSIATEYATTRQFSDALRYCNSAPEPFFAYIPTNACHSPLLELPPSELVNTPEYMVGPPTFHKNFSATLEALDSELGKFLDGMDAERKARTTFILMGDNGPDGTLFESLLYDSNMDLGPTYRSLVQDSQERFKHSVYEGALRVPMIAWGKGVAEPGRTTNALIDVTDIFPTVAEIFGANPGNVDGVSFKRILDGPGIDIGDHQRDQIVSDFFFANGYADEATDMRQIGCQQYIKGAGRFKLVRKIGLPGWSQDWNFLPNPGDVWDEFYQLYDDQGNSVDPRELAPLDTAVGSPFRAHYKRLAGTLDEAVFDSGPSVFCSSLPNSSGGKARISANGSASTSAADLELVVTVAPPNSAGFFFYAWYETDVPLGNGVLCLSSGGNGLHRMSIISSGNDGVFTHPVDFDELAIKSAAIDPGSTWKFQAWFRDVAAGGAMSNTSSALTLHFAP